jgi:hypothetical protein
MIGNIVAGTFSAGVAPSTNSYESIATVNVGSGGAANVQFTSIPSTYKHLQIRYIAKCVAGVSDISYLFMQANGNTSSSYAYHRLTGDGSSAIAAAATSSAFMLAQQELGTTGGFANIYSGGVIDILDYSSTTKNKTFRILSGADFNGSGRVGLNSGFWTGTGATNAISSLTFYSQDSRDLAQYTQFALYGIKD